MGTPPAEVTIDEQLIASLIETQAPQYAQLPVSIVAHGWDNVTARLGDEYAARLPRRELGATLTRCARTPDSPPGDPCYHQFRVAVQAGALPFTLVMMAVLALIAAVPWFALALL